jgi:hypothetical protein
MIANPRDDYDKDRMKWLCCPFFRALATIIRSTYGKG